MKAWMKSGLCLALGWVATRSDAQEINWRPAVPHNSNIAVVTPPKGNTDTGVRPVGLSRPTPIDLADPSASLPSFRPVLDRPQPVVRGQAPDDRVLGKGVFDPNPSKSPAPRPNPIAGENPRPMPSPEFIPPQPQPAGQPPLSVSPFPPANNGSIWGGVGSVNMNDILGIHQGGGIDDCNACGVGGCNTDCCMPRPLRFWVSGEYLMWWTRSQSVPTLVTGSPTSNTSADAGKLGDPASFALYDSVENNLRSGARFNAGFWFPGSCNWGMDASYFFLGRQVTDNTFGAEPGLGVFRPFVNVPNNNSPAVELVNTGPVRGTVNINTFSELWGGDINLRRKLWCGPSYWVDGLIGYRHLELNEGLTITENLTVNNNGTPGSIIVQDSFRTFNQFDGGQIGLAGEYRLGRRWSLFGTVKVAMGNVHQTVEMAGSTSFNIPPIPASVQPGGLLVQNSNAGRYSVDRFAVMPEVGIKIGWDLTERLRLYAGYDFMYLSSVVRPGDQIDTGLDPVQLPTAVGPGRPSAIGRPAVLFHTTDFWAQGLNFGMMYKY